MIIGFYQPHLCLRGTTVAMYDYAFYNEQLLGNKSIIFYIHNHHNNNIDVINQFDHHFKLIPLSNQNELDKQLNKYNCDAVYITKTGYKNDGRMASACKTLIHAIGTVPPTEAHGDVFAYGSYWLSQHCSQGTIPAVPYMVDLPDISGDLREELNIPYNATVFGRNGGIDTWNIPFVNKVIQNILQKRNDIYFLFQNTPLFYEHKNIIYLDSTPDINFKVKFINSCDAMLHARVEGESFGLSCAEFSVRNKPVITWVKSKERNHICALGDKGIYYADAEHLDYILNNFNPDLSVDWNCYKAYNPVDVMNTFRKVFLK